MTQFAFRRTGDADYPKYLKVLLQGPPKAGKTTFIATAPNVVVAACEAGLASIAHLDVPYVDITGTDDLQKLAMILGDDTLRDHTARQLGLPKIESVAIDTLDAWQEMLKKEILAETKRPQLQMADWGTLKERMSAILKKFVSLPVNVIFTVHTTTTQDDEQRLIYAPALQGGIKDEIAGYVDFSLLAFRQRETDTRGVASINYYLKCEGDQKNPHLGNRAAGRLPEIAKPDFMTLHQAVFAPVARRGSSVATDTTAPVVAQAASQPVAVTPAPLVAKATGVPVAESDDAKISASGVTSLTKSYTEHALTVPEDLKTWTLGKGRLVAKWFMAWKADRQANQAVTREDLISGLTAYEAFAGEITGVQTGTAGVKPPGKSKQEPAAPKADVTSTEDPQEAAVALVQQELGGQVVAHQAAEGAPCAECGEPVDEPDIANLAVIKFKKALCLRDYKAAVAAANK